MQFTVLRALVIAASGALGYRSVTSKSKDKSTLIKPALGLLAGTGAFLLIKRLKG